MKSHRTGAAMELSCDAMVEAIWKVRVSSQVQLFVSGMHAHGPDWLGWHETL